MICQKCGKEFKGTITVICPQCIREQEQEAMGISKTQASTYGECRLCGKVSNELINGVCQNCLKTYQLDNSGTEQDILAAERRTRKHSMRRFLLSFAFFFFIFFVSGSSSIFPARLGSALGGSLVPSLAVWGVMEIVANLSAKKN